MQKERSITPAIAGKIALSLLWLWQTRSYPRLSPVSIYGIKKYIAEPHVQELAAWISEHPFLDATFWLSSAYALLVGDDYQNRYAMYFTPPSLADRLIDNLIARGASLTKDRWADPACGGGAFLTPVAVRMVARLLQDGEAAEKVITTVARNLVGNDIDPVLATLSKNFICMAMHEQITCAGFIPELKISCADSLLLQKRNQICADVIVCNPPYRKMSRDEVDIYRASFGDVIEGQPNLYGLFMRKCLSIAGPRGLIGLLTPTSYLSGQNFSRLRKRVTDISDVRQLDLIRQREGVFLRVEQETALSIFQNKPANVQSLGSATVCIFEENRFIDVGSFKPPLNGDAWVVPRDTGDVSILKNAGNSPYRLCDYGYAVRTGSYVYYRDKRATYATRPPPSGSKTAIFPLIWSSDITTDGNLVHGRVNKQERRDTYIDMQDYNHVSVIRRPSVALQRITSADQGRRLIGAAVPDEIFKYANGVVGENHVLFLEQVVDNPPVTPAQLAAVLGSDVVDRLFRCISGAVNVSIFELNQLPMPSPEVLKRLLADGHCSIDEAVRDAFSWPQSGLSGSEQHQVAV